MFSLKASHPSSRKVLISYYALEIGSSGVNLDRLPHLKISPSNQGSSRKLGELFEFFGMFIAFYSEHTDVKMDHLNRTDTTTECPFKRAAHLYSLKGEDKTLDDAVWTYEEPFEEHQDLKERLAFYEDGFRDIKIEKIAA